MIRKISRKWMIFVSWRRALLGVKKMPWMDEPRESGRKPGTLSRFGAWPVDELPVKLWRWWTRFPIEIFLWQALLLLNIHHREELDLSRGFVFWLGIFGKGETRMWSGLSMLSLSIVVAREVRENSQCFGFRNYDVNIHAAHALVKGLQTPDSYHVKDCPNNNCHRLHSTGHSIQSQCTCYKIWWESLDNRKLLVFA